MPKIRLVVLVLLKPHVREARILSIVKAKQKLGIKAELLTEERLTEQTNKQRQKGNKGIKVDTRNEEQSNVKEMQRKKQKRK